MSKLRKCFVSAVLAAMLVLGLPAALYAQCVSCSTIYSQMVADANQRLSQCLGYVGGGTGLVTGCYAEYAMRMSAASAAYAACKLVPDCPA